MTLQQSIDRFVVLVHGHSALPAELAEEAAALRERLSAGQLHLAVMGQFKRGKSTLINALLGAEILPAGVLPVTLVPVYLRFGAQPSACGALHERAWSGTLRAGSAWRLC